MENLPRWRTPRDGEPPTPPDGEPPTPPDGEPPTPPDGEPPTPGMENPPMENPPDGEPPGMENPRMENPHPPIQEIYILTANTHFSHFLFKYLHRLMSVNVLLT